MADQNLEQKVVQKIGKYEILAELGQGGMGTVYKAKDPFIGRLVALKTINAELVSDQEILKRFYREAQSAGTLQHPNIVTIYDLGEADGRPYIAMEFVEGENLQALINRRAKIPLAAKLSLVQQFCEGLSHAHKHGFVHRDVKPANIQVTSDGNVKVMDFGIVHLETTNLTKTGMFLGTIHYASPEQINDGRVDNKSDVWSVACVIYELIAYKKAFDGSNIAAIIAKVLSSEPEPLSRCCPGVPVELDAVISKGVAKNVDDRYQSLDELLGELLPIARNLQQSFIGDLLSEAKDLRERHDFNGAQEKVRAVLILDKTHGEAKRLHGEIAADLQRMTPVLKAKRLVAEAEQAFSRGEYAEAVRILGEAQELNPADTQARVLTEKAKSEQARVIELREALGSGQKAMKQGDLTGAEQELYRVLQLDQSNAQARELLEQIRQDRQSRERDFRLKEALWQTDNLVSEGKYEEAQNRLLELQQDFPAAEEVHLKLQILDPFIRARKLAQDGEQAFNQGEYAEAVRALTEALELNPRDEQARELKNRALQERDRLRQVREALGSGQRAMRQGDIGAAERELQRALGLDPTNTQATSLMGQIRQAQATRDRESRFRQSMQQTDGLIAEGKFDDAQRSLMELQQEFPDSTEIDQKLLELDQQMKLHRLVLAGQTAYDQGEFGEAVRILTEAQELGPGNTKVRDLKARAVQERDRLRQVREAISAGQKALRQSDDGTAEREFKKALQLDAANAQATSLLAQLKKDREAREQERRLKEGLSQAEKLITKKKFDEAQRKLAELQQAFPDAEEVQQKLQLLNQRKAEAAAPPPAAVPASLPDKTPSRGAPASEIARTMDSAEALRRSLQNPRSAETGKPPAPAPGSTRSFDQPPLQATLSAEASLAESGAAQPFGATQMLPSLQSQPPAGEAPPAFGGPPPQIQAPPSSAPRADLKKPAAAPPRVTPAAPVAVAKEGSKMSPMILAAVGVLVVILAVGAYLFLHHPSSSGGGGGGGGAPTAAEAQLEAQAKVLQDKGDLAGALGKWQELDAANGGLKAEADTAIADLKQKIQLEQTTFDQAKADQDAKKWDDAIGGYTKVLAMNGTKRDAAQDAIKIINEVRKGGDISKIEQTAYSQGNNFLQHKQYQQAKNQFEQVLSLKVPNSNLAPKAQEELGKLDQLIQAKAEFDKADAAQNGNQLKDALAQFQSIGDKPGPYQAEAKARIPKLNEMINNAGAQAEYTAAVTIAKSDPKAALPKFQAIAAGSGPFKGDAQTQVKAINDQFAAQAAQAAQAQTQQQFDAAVAAQKGNDLNGALQGFKAVAAKPGPLAAVAEAKAELVAQLITDSTKPKVQTPPPPPPTPVATTTPPPAPTTGGAHAPSVTLIPSGDFEHWNNAVNKGQMIPDNYIEGGLKPVGALTVPAMDAPPKAVVIFIITIDPNGNVTPGRKTKDDDGIGPQVMPAAKAWKFQPPMVKGKPVSTSIQVRVAF